MYKFPSIEGFPQVIRNIRHQSRYQGRDEQGNSIFDHTIPYPKVEFVGTTKLHGTCASIEYNVVNSEITYHSRERTLSLTQDNAGFMLYMKQREDYLHQLFEQIADQLHDNDILGSRIIVYGEFAGIGIQKTVAISELPKMFVVFAVKSVWEDREELSQWFDMRDFAWIRSDEHRIFNTFMFPVTYITIDFEHPEYSQQKLIEITEEIEKECPVGKFFGVFGVGEGVVYVPTEPRWRNSQNWFKCKGEKHSVSKVRTLVPIDVEAVKTMNEFVEKVVTENRLEQGLQNLVNEQLKPFEMKSMADFLRWIYNDVMKEHEDMIVASGIDPKKVGKPIANISRRWFIKKFQESAFAS